MISELIVNVDKEEINADYGIFEKIGYGIFKINLYNLDVPHPMQKYWFYITKAKIAEIDTNKKYITIILSNLENDKKTINIINKLNTNILDHINNTFNKYITQIERTHINNLVCKLRVNIDTNSNIFNNNGKCDVDQLKVESNISLYLELTEVIFNASQIWTIWNCLQVKILENIDFSLSFFDLENKKPLQVPLQVAYSTSIPSPPSSPSPFSSSPSSSPSSPPPAPKLLPKKEEQVTKAPIIKNTGPVRFLISQSEILNQLKKLKKTNMEDIIKKYEKEQEEEKINKIDRKKYKSMIKELNNIFGNK